MQNEKIKQGIIKSDDYQLRYSIEGKGLPLFVIGSEICYPRTFSQNLRNYFQFIFVDHRGFGISPQREMQNSEFELDVIIEDMEKTRQFLKLDKIILLGHSGHAFMALEYAKKYPEHVSHVVMVGIIPSLSEKFHPDIQKFWDENASPDRKAQLKKNEEELPDSKLSHLPVDQQFILQYIRSAPKIWYDYRHDASAMWKDVEINMQMFGYVWGHVFREIDITRGLENFNKPVFLGLGKYDFLAPYTLWNPILSHFKNLTLRLFEKSGHSPQLEESELFDNELTKWVHSN